MEITGLQTEHLLKVIAIIPLDDTDIHMTMNIANEQVRYFVVTIREHGSNIPMLAKLLINVQITECWQTLEAAFNEEIRNIDDG